MLPSVLLHHSVPTGGSFEPNDIASLVHWWDGRDEANIPLSGSDVASWTDSIGGLVSSVTTATSPTYNAIENTVVGDGSQLLRGASIDDLIRNGAFTAVAITKSPSSNSNSNRIFATRGDGSSRSRLYIGTNYFDFANSIMSFPKPYHDAPYIQIATCGATGISVPAIAYVNGAQVATTTYATRNTSGVDSSLFGYPSGQPEFEGSIYHVLFFSEILSTENLQKVEGWAAHEDEFASELPVDHPYKISPP